MDSFFKRVVIIWSWWSY